MNEGDVLQQQLREELKTSREVNAGLRACMSNQRLKVEQLEATLDKMRRQRVVERKAAESEIEEERMLREAFENRLAEREKELEKLRNDHAELLAADEQHREALKVAVIGMQEMAGKYHGQLAQNRALTELLASKK